MSEIIIFLLHLFCYIPIVNSITFEDLVKKSEHFNIRTYFPVKNI